MTNELFQVFQVDRKTKEIHFPFGSFLRNKQTEFASSRGREYICVGRYKTAEKRALPNTIFARHFQGIETEVSRGAIRKIYLILFNLYYFYLYLCSFGIHF